MERIRRINRPVIVLAAGVLTGCTSAASSPPATPAATSPATATTQTATTAMGTTTTTPAATTLATAAGAPQQQALASYRAMWAAWVTAAQTSDPTSKTVGRYASGDALRLILTSLAQDKQEGMVTRGQPVLNPRIQAVTPAATPTHVTIADCADDSRWLKYRASDGALKDRVPGGRQAVTAVVQNVAGTWLVVKFLVDEVGTC